MCSSDLLDAVAHSRVKTPTAAAELLIGLMDEAANRLIMLSGKIKESVMLRLDSEYRRIENYRVRIPSAVSRRLADARLRLVLLQKDMDRSVPAYLSTKHHRLDLLKQRVKDASPERILAKGYSNTLKDGKIVTDANQLKEGDEVTTRLINGDVKSIVK